MCLLQSIVPGQDLQKQLEKEFKFVPVIKYKDPEGDKVSMKKQGDFEVPHRQTLKAPC
jgi:desulfoferrodoxin (superoxide reductase-like protein)